LAFYLTARDRLLPKPNDYWPSGVGGARSKVQRFSKIYKIAEFVSVICPFGQPFDYVQHQHETNHKAAFYISLRPVLLYFYFQYPVQRIDVRHSKTEQSQKKKAKTNVPKSFIAKIKSLGLKEEDAEVFISIQKLIGQQFIRIIRFIVPKVASRNAISLLK